MADADSDRNLLFGLLALQNGLIDQGALFAAFAAWTRDKGRPLADHLVDLGHLDAPRRDAVESIAALHIQTVGGDPGKSLAVLTVGRSTRESLARAGGPEVEATLGHVGSAQDATHQDGDSGRTGTYSVGSVTSDGQRFRIVRPHARGGLGAVFVAMDSELDREVALKQILDDRADDPTSRFRFLVEAQITGGLEHPGIVPVYGLGSHDDGRPYYAMRFIRGESLQEAIDRFHAASRSGSRMGRDAAPLPASLPGSRDLELRKLLRRFLDVCNAIDYAHSRGVIHRDIKPANIILGKHGETLVVDWGLAKPTGWVEPGTESGERMLMPAWASGGSETLPGSTLGTPAYMSPEQAEGRLDRQGPWSDVYCLGATLYCLLTGRPPFAGDGINAVLRAVREGEFSRPRKLDPSIDKALEAICLRAMALEPGDRYRSPRALADDIEHWLADAPVEAYPERRLERLGRWLRQHRTWTYAAVAALVATSLAATIGVVVVDGARRREAEVRKEAEANFLMAQRAVDDYLTSVSENTLLKQQDSVDIRSLRQELLNNALTYYKSFVNQRSDDPRLRHQLANAYYRVGEITRVIGSLSEATEAFRSALGLWEPLAAAEPGNHELRGRLADCHQAIGNLQYSTDDFQPAMTSLTRASAILETLTDAHPEVPAYQASLAACYLRMGIVLGDLRSTDQAGRTLEKAKTIQERLIARVQGRPADQRLLAEIVLATGTLQYERRDYPGALQSFQEARRICQSELDGITVGPKPVRLLDLLAISHYNIAAIQREDGQLEEALQSFERSLEYRSALVDAHPSVTLFQEHLGKNLGEIAVLQHDALQEGKALASIKRSIEILERLVRSQPDQPRYQHDLGRSWNIQGYLHDQARQTEPAILAFDRAIAAQSRAAAASPEVDMYKVELCSQLDNLGEQYVALGRVGDALPHYRRQIVIWQELLAARPGNPGYALKLAEALTKLGNIRRHAGDSTAARESYFDARSLLERGAAASPGDGVLRVRLGTTLIREAGALAELRGPEEARPLLERAVRILSDASLPPTEQVSRRESLSDALWELARILRVSKDTAEAGRVDARRVALWQDRRPRELAALALKQTSLAATIGYGKTPISPAALSVRELDLDQAAANIQLAIALGFRDIRMLESHPDSHLLHARADLELLIMDMAFPDRPFGDP